MADVNHCLSREADPPAIPSRDGDLADPEDGSGQPPLSAWQHFSREPQAFRSAELKPQGILWETSPDRDGHTRRPSPSAASALQSPASCYGPLRKYRRAP